MLKEDFKDVRVQSSGQCDEQDIWTQMEPREEERKDCILPSLGQTLCPAPQEPGTISTTPGNSPDTPGFSNHTCPHDTAPAGTAFKGDYGLKNF